MGSKEDPAQPKEVIFLNIKNKKLEGKKLLKQSLISLTLEGEFNFTFSLGSPLS